jgi:hypothetical protein
MAGRTERGLILGKELRREAVEAVYDLEHLHHSYSMEKSQPFDELH